MRRGWWVVVIGVAVVVVLGIIGAITDDRSSTTAPPGFASDSPARSPLDAEAVRAAQRQFDTVFARCGEIYRTQRTELQPLSGGAGPTLARPAPIAWEYRGVTFDPRPVTLAQVDTFNDVTWKGEVLVIYAAERRGAAARNDTLWQSGQPLALTMMKRKGEWQPALEIDALKKQRWSPACR